MVLANFLNQPQYNNINKIWRLKKLKKWYFEKIPKTFLKETIKK
jgi:hypothetical protein